MRPKLFLLAIALTSCIAITDARGQFDFPVGRPRAPVAAPLVTPTAQVLFRAPDKMRVDDDLDVDKSKYQPVVAPARRNLPQGKVTSLLFSSSSDERKFEIKGTLEVYRATPRSSPYLEKFSIPMEIDEADVITALTGRVVTKAIYLPSDVVDMIGENSSKTIASINGEGEKSAETIAGERGTVLAVLRLTAVDAGIPGGVFPKVKDFTLLEDRRTVKYAETASEPPTPAPAPPTPAPTP